MLNLLSLVIGVVALLLAIVAFIPFLGWANWAIIPLAMVGALIGFLSSSNTGRNLNLALRHEKAMEKVPGGTLIRQVK